MHIDNEKVSKRQKFGKNSENFGKHFEKGPTKFFEEINCFNVLGTAGRHFFRIAHVKVYSTNMYLHQVSTHKVGFAPCKSSVPWQIHDIFCM